MNLYTENMKFIQNHMDEKEEWHKGFGYKRIELLYEFRVVNLNYGRQTGKTKGVTEFISHEKIKNPKRDIIIVSYKDTMNDGIKRDYRNHCLDIGLIPTQSPIFTSFGGKTAKRTLNNDYWWSKFRGLTFNRPIFIIDEPIEISIKDFLDKFETTCRYEGLPTFYIIGTQ